MKNATNLLKGDSGAKYLNTLAEFQDWTVNKSKEKLVVIDFTAAWCGPCKQIAPHYNQLAQQHDGKAYLFKIDVDKNKEAAGAAGISAMPTFKFYAKGQLVDTI